METKTTNLFASAKKVETKTGTVTKHKEFVFVPGTEQDILRKLEIKGQLANLKAEDEMISGRLKDIARPQILKMFHTKKVRPESFYLADGNAKIMVILQDAYKKVEEAKEAALEAYPGVLETKQVYTINPDLLEKCGAAISAAILNSPDISEEDKANIILCEEKKQVAKGTIDRLLSFENPDQLFYLIEPTVALK